METVVPPKLRRGDLVRVVTPAMSRQVVVEYDHTSIIEARFASLGLRLSYGRHVDERDRFDSTAIANRVSDLHDAFADPEVAAISTVIGGFNCNELLPYLDFDLIAANPKILCGYSDITALQNAILARAGLVTYSGPHWSAFGMRDHFEQTLDWFHAALFRDEPIEVRSAEVWTDDLWFADQDARTLLPGQGWWTLQPGRAAGRIVGGNLCTLNLLQGTSFMPSLDGSVLLVEDDASSDAVTFARDLTSLLQVPDARGVQGLVIGRFQQESAINREHIEQIVANQAVLADRPVLANADFGHTNPMITFPIGGRASLEVNARSSFTIVEH